MKKVIKRQWPEVTQRVATVAARWRPEVPTLRRLRWHRPPKVFCVGLIKTGTTSLGKALEQMGYEHTHDRRNQLLSCVETGSLEEVFRWVDKHDSFDDWPWPLLYRELEERYPDSRFILTTRLDEATWLKSVKRHAHRFGPSPGRELFFGEAMPDGHEEAYLEAYLVHNEAVRRHFHGKGDRLLEVCWEKGDGWETLCRFLGRPTPRVSFPKLNTASAPIDK